MLLTLNSGNIIPASNWTGYKELVGVWRHFQHKQGRKYHSSWICSPQAHLGSSNVVFDH